MRGCLPVPSESGGVLAVGLLNDLLAYAIMVAPAVVGVGAMIGSIHLIRRPRKPTADYTGRWIAVGALLVLALGIGTCYAWMLSGPNFGG